MGTFRDAQPYVTGACHFVVKPKSGVKSGTGGGGGGSALYLGTSEFSPYMEIDKAYVPLFNDLGGPIVPFDLCYAGKQAFVSADLTRFEMGAITTIQADPTFGSDDLGSALTDGDQDVGTLLDTEDLGLELFLVFPYQAVSAYSSLYRGYHFLICAGMKVTWARLGTQPVKIHVDFHCIRHFDPATKTFQLADESIDEAVGVI